MSVDQTTQLIQLILNSVLLTVACALVMGGARVRHRAAEKSLTVANRRYAALWKAGGNGFSAALPSGTDNRLVLVKKALRRSQKRYTLTHHSLLAIYYALLFAIASTLAMALRALFHGDWLIVVALTLFVISIAVLLLSIGLTLIDLHSSDRPLLEELGGFLGLATVDAPSRVSAKNRSPKPNQRLLPAGTKPSIKARVG